MNERLKEIRVELKISQEEFGRALGVTKASISRLESGINNITDQMCKSICREFRVDYIWFTTGKGEMFFELPKTAIDNLVMEYKLDNEDRQILENYLKLDSQKRETIKSLFRI